MIHSLDANGFDDHFTHNTIPFMETNVVSAGISQFPFLNNVFETCRFHNHLKFIESCLQNSNYFILYIKRVCTGCSGNLFKCSESAIVCVVDKSSRCTTYYGQQMARCFYATCHCARQFWSINSTICEQIQLYGKIEATQLDKNSAETVHVFEVMCLTFKNWLATINDCQF